MMTVKEAVDTAKQQVVLLFEAEDISDLGLEEIYFDPDAECWQITIGFTRPWDRKLPPAALSLREDDGALLQNSGHQRCERRCPLG